MDKQDIIRMAREAGLTVKTPSWGYTEHYRFAGFEQPFERFAALVADAERHECAKIVDGNADGCTGMTEQILRSNAAAIRARGQA